MILVIEDNQMVAELFAQAITSEGYQADIASDGKEALRKLMENSYLMAFVDLGIPEMDGIEVVSSARAAGITIPMIAVTGGTETSDKLMILSGFSGPSIRKPVRLSALTDTIRAWCGPPKEL